MAPLALLAAGSIVWLLSCRENLTGNESSTLILAVKADVTGVFPGIDATAETYSIHINANVFEGLVGLDPNLKIVPALAERWQNPDARTWIFDLRPNLLFSDGQPVTAEDVAVSFRAALDQIWFTRYFLRSIESVRSTSRTRVEIVTKGPDPLLLSQLPWGFVIPARFASRLDTVAIGTGPYRIVNREPGKELVLSRNPHYRGRPPQFDQVRLVVEADDRTRVDRVLSGKADFADHVPFHDIRQLRLRPDVRTVVRPSLFVLYLGMRVDRKPFSDPRVREAVELAIDRQALVDHALEGLAEPAFQVVPSTVVGFNSQLDAPRPSRDRARSLLAAAGFRQGLSLRLDGTTDRYAGDERILGEVARQLGEVGIRVEVDAVDKAAFFRRLEGQSSDFHLVGWSSDSGDAGGVLEAVFHTRQGKGPLGNGNTMGLSDATLDRLIDDMAQSRTLNERRDRLRRALGRVAELRPVIPLVVQSEAYLLSPRILWEPPLNLALRFADIRKAE